MVAVRGDGGVMATAADGHVSHVDMTKLRAEELFDGGALRGRLHQRERRALARRLERRAQSHDAPVEINRLRAECEVKWSQV